MLKSFYQCEGFRPARVFFRKIDWTSRSGIFLLLTKIIKEKSNRDIQQI